MSFNRENVKQDDIVTDTSAEHRSEYMDTEEEDLLVSQLNVDILNQYVVFSVGNEEYGVPILTVQEIISMPQITRIPGMPEFIPGIIDLRGSVIPLYILRNKFLVNIEDAETESVVIITQIDEKKTVGMVVDSVSDVVSITEENQRETPDFSGTIDVKFIEKIGQLGNRMIMILNLDNLFSDNENQLLDSIAKDSSTV
ncbi:MAG: purine-binding chemotaxis protein CheW [Spirochaetales bacterium]|nr:purine-binding chemotaxis protein CheW [Spirochaetales bacterium]